MVEFSSKIAVNFLISSLLPHKLKEAKSYLCAA